MTMTVVFAVACLLTATEPLHVAGAPMERVPQGGMVAQERAWTDFFGFSIEITFGTNIPSCRCCYGGICSVKATIPFFLKKGPMNDEYIASQVRGFQANDQASIGRTSTGEVYLLFNRDISRSEFLGSHLTITAPVHVDPVLVKQYNIPQIPAGTYDIIDNGLFKMIRIQ
ncbi:MAG: hypothetical protein ACKOB6_04605 [Candidatus Kapaibacterium sp.]